MNNQFLRIRGFTMIELLVVIAVIAILTTIAAPSFSKIIANQRAKTIASELLTSLSKARSEAIKRNADVTLAAKSGDWANGWSISDPGNAAIVLEDRGAAAGATVAGPAVSTGVIFNPVGHLKTGTSATFVITTAGGDSNFYRCVALDLSGRPYTKAAQTC